MNSINSFALLAAFFIGQGEDVERDTIRIKCGRPMPVQGIKLKNGYVVAGGSVAEFKDKRLISISFEREMRRVHPDAPALMQRVHPESSVSDLEIGTVIPIGNVLVRLDGGDSFSISGMVERSKEYDDLSRGLGEGIIAYNSRSFGVGEQDWLALEEIQSDSTCKSPTFSGRILHRGGPFGKIDDGKTVVIKKAKVGDVIQIADLKLRVLNIVPPDKALRITGWVAFELP